MRRMNKTLFGNLCEEQAYLYIVKLHNDLESFYKIGVTSKKEVSSRFSGIPYNYEIIKTYSHPSSTFIMDLESQLLSLVERYNPLKTFGGYSECVLEVENIIKYVESLSWITELEEFVPSTYKTALGRNPSVIKLMKEYQTLLTTRRESDFSEESKEAVEAFLIDNAEFASWLDAGITLSEMNSCGRTRDKIEELVSNKTRLAKATVSFKDFSGYSENMFVTKKELKEKIQAYYNMLGINLKAKSTDIGKYSETENTTKLIESKRENGIRIVRFI